MQSLCVQGGTASVFSHPELQGIDQHVYVLLPSTEKLDVHDSLGFMAGMNTSHRKCQYYQTCSVVDRLGFTGGSPCISTELPPFADMTGRTLARLSLKAHSISGPQA